MLTDTLNKTIIKGSKRYLELMAKSTIKLFLTMLSVNINKTLATMAIKYAGLTITYSIKNIKTTTRKGIINKFGNAVEIGIKKTSKTAQKSTAFWWFIFKYVANSFMV